jgi:phosphatidylinositol alpha-1,6-mannosyltransferase
MRIALLSKRFPPQRCGVGDYAAELARALAAQGHAVTVFVASHADGRPADVPVREIQLSTGADIAAAVRAMVEAGPELVLMEYSGYAWGRWGIAFWMNRFALRLRRSGVRVAVALHEISISARAFPRWAPLALLQTLHAWLLALAAHDVVVNTREREARVRRWLFWRRARVHYRPNSSNIRVSPITPEQREAVRAARGAAPQTLVVAVFGMFAAWKKYEEVIRAVAALRGTLDLRLWLLGDWTVADAGYTHALREMMARAKLEDLCWWSGPLAEEEISAHLQAADIFALPQADGDLTRSGAFLAAAAHGLACVAVRHAENQQEFTHGKNVWLVGRSAAQEFRAALETLAADSALRRRLGAALRALYDAAFTIERVAAGLPFLRAAAAAEAPSAKVSQREASADSSPVPLRRSGSE